jgi:uncharacterized protein
MNRRNIFGFLAISTALMQVSQASRATPVTGGDAGKKTHGLALHVDQNDPEIMNNALNFAQSAVKYYAEQGGDVSIEIVANGAGLHMFRDDTSPVKERLKAFHARMPQVAFSVCANSKRAMESAEDKEIKIVPEAKIVPAGIVSWSCRSRAGVTCGLERSCIGSSAIVLSKAVHVRV